MQVLPTIALTNGIQATTDILVGIMPIQQVESRQSSQARNQLKRYEFVDSYLIVSLRLKFLFENYVKI